MCDFQHEKVGIKIAIPVTMAVNGGRYQGPVGVFPHTKLLTWGEPLALTEPRLRHETGL